MTATPTTHSPVQLLFPDLAHELATTRRVLERVPADRADWKPHAKSMSLGRLASHVAELPGFAGAIMGTDELDFAQGGYVPLPFESTAQVLAAYDERAGRMQALVADTDWDTLGREWVLRAGDRVILRSPKGALLRSFVLGHLAHHRGQLGVYLRLLDVAVPSVYGPTADEQ